MAKTWENFECTFNTQNTSNTLPDSKYFVTKEQMCRVAFVNLGPGRPASQAVASSQAVCYLKPGSDLVNAVMQQGDDSLITIQSVTGDSIQVGVSGVPKGGVTVGSCSRVPMNGLITFDFSNNDGVLSHIHVGHAVANLSPGMNAGTIPGTINTMEGLKKQVEFKSQMQQELLREVRKSN